jgi:predicted NUDIX family NTP pyrophosphohydrolase
LLSNFSEFYYEHKDLRSFNNIFEKWYSKKYWGEIEKNKIKKQQLEWYLKLKKIIEEKDVDGLFFVVSNWENCVTRDLVSEMLGINIKRGTVDLIKERIENKILNLKESKKINCSGSLQYKINKDGLYVFLGNKQNFVFSKGDNWIIPHSFVNEKESLDECAIRSFKNEIGKEIKNENFIDLGDNKTQYKNIHIYAFEGNFKFNNRKKFDIEWPIGSGIYESVLELKDASFFHIDEAYKIINNSYRIFLDRLKDKLNNEKHINSK